eukprot:9485686-Pyramimonas_sp.AAC.1
MAQAIDDLSFGHRGRNVRRNQWDLFGRRSRNLCRSQKETVVFLIGRQGRNLWRNKFEAVLSSAAEGATYGARRLISYLRPPRAPPMAHPIERGCRRRKFRWRGRRRAGAGGRLTRRAMMMKKMRRPMTTTIKTGGRTGMNRSSTRTECGRAHARGATPDACSPVGLAMGSKRRAVLSFPPPPHHHQLLILPFSAFPLHFLFFFFLLLSSSSSSSSTSASTLSTSSFFPEDALVPVSPAGPSQALARYEMLSRETCVVLLGQRGAEMQRLRSLVAELRSSNKLLARKAANSLGNRGRGARRRMRGG